jgi:hypothetical protein
LSHFSFTYPNFWIVLATSKKSVNTHAYCTMYNVRTTLFNKIAQFELYIRA